MAGFIEEFYFGNIDPQARGVKENSRIQKQMAILSGSEERLTRELTGKEKETFLDYVNAWGEVLSFCNLDSFIIGFRLGAQFTYDTFVSDETPFVDYTKG